MKTVEVKFEGTVELFVVLVESQKLKFDDGVASIELKEGQEYAIQWFVRGAPQSKYTIKITKPKEAKFVHTATLDSHMKDAGVFWFTLNEGD
jgi:hypothetical protein